MQHTCEDRQSDSDQTPGFSSRGDIDVNSLPLIQKYLERFPPEYCEHNIVNLFCWAEIYQYQWFCFRERLMNYDSRNNILMMPPGPDLSPEDLYAVAHDMMDAGLCASIGLVTKSYLRDNPGIRNYFHVEEDRDSAEYIYRTESLIQLNTKKLHKKKNLVSQFHRRYPDHRVRPVTREMTGKIQGFAKDLVYANEPVADSLKEEIEAIEKAFRHWDLLGLEGLVLYVEDHIAAFSIFSPLSRNTVNIHFEKANIAYKGAAQVINQETAIYLQDRFAFINREQDLGVPGLRQAKLSYEPYLIKVPHMLRLKANA